MAAGPNQHVVPVQMIRRFANDNGRLFCLKKDTLEVPDTAHGNIPEDILHRRHYYTGQHIDLDEAWLQPREAAFASLYPKLADQEASAVHFDPEESRVFMQWLVTLQCRGELIAEALAARNSREYLRRRTGVLVDAQGLVNLTRMQLAEAYESLYTSPGWTWRLLVLRQGGLVLSDNPICHTTIGDALGPMVFVPLSKTRLIIGGTAQGVQRMARRGLARDLNLFIASWSKRLIYGQSVEQLERLADQLRNASAAARLPFHGVTERMRTGPAPKPRPEAEDDSVFEYIKKVMRDAAGEG